MKTRITLSRRFEVDGVPATLTAGVKNGSPVVVLGLLEVPFSELANITIEYPMKSETSATKFVMDADDDVIRRGIAKYRDEVEEVARKVNDALLRPYNPHSYTSRGQKEKGPA